MKFCDAKKFEEPRSGSGIDVPAEKNLEGQ